MGQSQSALWTMPLVATQYQPLQPTPAMLAALQAQNEGRFLDALILLDEANINGRVGSMDSKIELALLRASFLLQGNQPQQALEILSPLLTNPQYTADANALMSMAYLQQGQMQKAQQVAQSAQDSGGGMLSHLALSYALQGQGHLAEARTVMHAFNARTPQMISLAREAELALTLDQISSAESLLDKAHEMGTIHPYVTAVNGLALLINGHAAQAKLAFETALQRDPKDAKALFGLGLAEIKLGNLQVGKKRLQEANEADPDNALILTYLGRAQQQLGQSDAAKTSWRSAQQADPKDPAPWLYQAQAELQANRLQDARESLRAAQARTAYRSVYRGEHLLQEDAQLLQANLAEIQRRMGLESLAFHTLADSIGEKNAANLRNQADLLQGQRFGESARRSLLLQSLFDDRPGNLPAELDIYGDGAGQTGAQAPQHGTVSMLNAQQASYNNYDSLIAQQHTMLVADAIAGGQNTQGEQVRAGVGSDTLGLSIAMRQYRTDGLGQPPNLLNNPGVLDNHIAQGIVQWRPNQSTQAFVVYQTFHSLHGETTSPWDPINLGTYHLIEDSSSITRLGLRKSLGNNSELRGLLSRQQTSQTDNNEYISFMLPYSNLAGLGPFAPFPQATQYASSDTHSAELQYRTGDAGSVTQWGVQLYRGPYIYGSTLDLTSNVQQLYAARQQTLNPYWQLNVQLAWGKMDIRDNTGSGNSVYLNRWLPGLGLVYSPNEATHVRLATWRDMNGDTVGDATLAPATLAGIVTKLPGARNNLVRGIVLGADRQLGSAWLIDGQAQRHIADQPASNGNFYSKRIEQSRLGLHWQPGNWPVAASLAYEYEYVLAPPASQNIAWDSVQEQRLHSQQLGLRWFANTQWTVGLDWSYNQISATMQSSDIAFNPILVPYQESFNQMDISVDWQLNKTGSMNIGVRNAGNRQFQYTGIDPLNPRFSNGRLIYARLKLLW